MIFSSLAEQYYDWLYKSVCGEWEPRNLSFHRLLMFLYNRNYVPACEMDISRAADGTNLRYRFATENDISYARIDSAFTGIPCSMLEMMVGLSIRIEEHILEDSSAGKRTGQWFWNMVVSLGLAAMDDQRFDEERAESVIERFSRRDYKPNGAGGLFTLSRPTEDMRTIDIWYQLMGWLAEMKPDIYVSKICITMEGVIEQFIDDERVLMRITSCRNTEHIGRLIFTDLNYWRKMNNGNDECHVRTGDHQVGS